MLFILYTYNYSKILSLTLTISFILFFIKRYKLQAIIFICLITLFFMQVSNTYQNKPPSDYQGQVIAISPSYYQVKLKDQVILLYSKVDLNFGDQISFNGQYQNIKSVSNTFAYNFQKTMNNQAIFYQIKTDDINIEASKSNYKSKLFNRINQIANPEYYQKLILGINTFDSELKLSQIIISSGVMIQSLIRSLRKILAIYFYDDNFDYYEIILYVILALTYQKYAFYTFLALRIIFRHLSLSRLDKFSLAAALTLFIFPTFGFSMAFIVVALFQFVYIIKREPRSFFVASLIMLPLSLRMNYEVSLLQIIIYPLIRTYYSFLFLIAYIDLILLTNFSYKIFTTFNLSFDYFKITGHLPLILLLAWIIISLRLLQSFKFYKVILLTTILIINQYQLIFSPSFIYHQLYVGQGDATLLTYPFKVEVTLIDTGSPFNQTKLQSALNYYGIKTIQNLIISHDDADHAGNLDYLNNNYTVKHIIREVGTYDFYQLKLNNYAYDSDDENDSSLITYFVVNDIAYLLLGDISKEVEVKFLQDNYDLDYHVLKLAHHGSNTSTSNEILDNDSLKLLINSSGLNNMYNHPSPKVLERINHHGLLLVDTQDLGDILIKHFARSTYLSIKR